MIWIYIAAPFALFYCWLMLYYYTGWQRLPAFVAAPPAASDNLLFTVLIPARNESQIISSLLESIQTQTLPKKNFEVIVIDDHSTDHTAAVVNEFANRHTDMQLRCIALADAGHITTAYKKKAMAYGVSHAKGSLIVSTDADCIVPPHWLAHLLSFHTLHQSKMIAAPVKYSFNKTFFQQFQALDFIGLIGITGASIAHGFYNMCNGANLCFEKNVFHEVGGYMGNDNISSGDDMFLMHKIAAAHPGKVHFIKFAEVTVCTHPKHSIGEFLHQRLRWTSKSAHYSDKRITAILVMAYLFNLCIAGMALCSWKTALLLLLLKTIAEGMFLRSVTIFFKQQKLLWIFLPSQPIHIVYVLAVGLLGQIGTFQWKGRNMRK